VLFAAFVVLFLVLDLGVFHRRAHAVRLKEALAWVAVWVSLAMAFNLWVWLNAGSEKGLQFLTGYLIELSLSVDNLFVFLAIFSYFAVPAILHHRVLFWGIVGAVLMRLVVIAAGVALVSRFQFVLYIFGAILIFTAYRLMFSKQEGVHPERNPVVRLFRRFFPVTGAYEGSRFLVIRERRLWATPLLIVLIVVETTDLVFALDSIPAIFGVTTDPFIIYTSNVFAILGLRAIFFAIAGFMELFRFLRYGLAAVLGFIGCKLMIMKWIHVSTGLSLGVVGSLLVLSVLASILIPKRSCDEAKSGPGAP
jgi:tellurite resistance protein TerC